ncbi:unnamed protein product [Pleuronectes platessa]|uniref:Uncharacterized protein n=1 Tax=Pleuronectes platessa TaxID=8262 RepID=A0A9N7TRP9_PLEPL|nr:unnamed protein product [Pleuronectes platessa]
MSGRGPKKEEEGGSSGSGNRDRKEKKRRLRGHSRLDPGAGWWAIGAWGTAGGGGWQQAADQAPGSEGARMCTRPGDAESADSVGVARPDMTDLGRGRGRTMKVTS